MRHTLSRASARGRVIGILAAGVAALALPGTSTGRPARAARAADQPQPLGTIVVPGAHTQPIPFGVEFKKSESYRIVVSGSVTHKFYDYPNHDPTQPAVYSGSVTFDPFYCYAGDGYIGYGLSCSPPVSAQVNYGNNVLHDQVSVGGQVHDQVLIGGIWPTLLPRPSYDQSNTYTLAWTPQADSTLAFYDGWMDSSNNAGYSVSAGAWTIQIYGPDTETVKFAVAQQGHRLLKKHAFEVTRTLGAGQVVVPTPQEGEEKVNSTSAKGSIRYSKIKLSPHGVLLLDEDGLTLRVKKAVFYPFDGVNSVLSFSVVVTKSTTDSCPLASTGSVLISDAGSDAIGSDRLVIGIPACKVHDDFRGKPGGGGKSDFVTVAITVVKP